MRLFKSILLAIFVLSIAACNLAASGQENNSVQEQEEENTDTPKPVESSESTDTPDPEIIHQMTPGDPVYIPDQSIEDCTTGDKIPENGQITPNPICDNWRIGAVERPYESDLVTFYPQYDILSAKFGQDDTWFYASISTYLASVDGDSIEGVFAVEIDLNLDNRGDVLILVQNPSTGDFSVAGVQVWVDSNNNIGSDTPIFSDDVDEGDGFDEMIFDAGIGADPDIAWARLIVGDPNQIEFAFKYAAIDNDQAFKWFMWASMQMFPVGEFDLNDNFDDQSIWGLDNSCAWLFGLPPQIGFPNLCAYQKDIPPTQKPGGGPGPTDTPGECRPPRGGCPSGTIWLGEPDCECHDLPK